MIVFLGVYINSQQIALCFVFVFFFFKQKTAYEILTCDWSSDVCSSDLATASILSLDAWRCRHDSLDAWRRRPDSFFGFFALPPRFFLCMREAVAIVLSLYAWRCRLDSFFRMREIGRASCRERV